MLPIPGSLLGAAFSGAARAIRGEDDLAETTRDDIQDLRDSIDDLSDIVRPFSPEDPTSWLEVAGRVLDESWETHGRAACARDWRSDRGFTASIDVGRALVDHLHGRDDIPGEVVFREEGESVELLQLAGGMVVALDEPREGTFESPRLYHRHDRPSALVRAALAETFWRSSDAIRLERQSEDVAFEPVDLESFVYHGDERERIARWQRFLEQDVRRNVLLHGAPGTGKTTLCCHAARELGDRTLLLNGDVLDRKTAADWKHLLELLSPTVLVVDDVERPASFAGGDDIGDRMRLFSEGRESVPLALFTANDPTELPGAMRRPGRIDEMVEFEASSSEIRRRVVRDIVDEYDDVDDVERYIEPLERLMDEYSAAYVREALERARTLGWEEVELAPEAFRMHASFDRLEDWLRVHDFERIEGPPGVVTDEVFERAEDVRLIDNEEHSLERLELATGASICRIDAGGERGPRARDRIAVRCDDEDELREGMAELFWRERRGVLLDSIDHEFVARTVALDGVDYLGPHTELIERLRAFRESGKRRSVLLQGPPGTGKSTLCLNAARELAERCLFLTPSAFEDMQTTDWTSLAESLRPDMVVIDDIDRVDGFSMESKLRLFEDRYCEIPYLLFTSNDLDDIPRPMKRPGRIDQIIEIESLDAERRREIVEGLADRIGVEPPDEQQLERLEELFERHSPAHVREVLRRADAVGWEHVEDMPGDRTFEREDETSQTLEPSGETPPF